MCTVMTSGSHIGRTMDFPPRTPWHLTYLPAGYRWRSAAGSRTVSNRYRVLGGMRHFGGHYLAGDGINAAGLFCAELFFPVAASYEEFIRPGTQGLTPQDFILWTLGNHHTVAELAADLPNVTVVGTAWYDGNYYPFHWLLQDESGTYVIEPLAGQLQITENRAGVLTNTPPLTQQIRRLNALLGARGSQFAPQAVANYTGPWPTGSNSAARFQQTALTRWQKAPQTVREMAEFLQTMTIPHNARHEHNYTHYRAVVDRPAREYYFTDCRQMTTIKKSLRTLNGPQAVTFR